MNPIPENFPKPVKPKKVKPLSKVEELIKAFTIEATRKGCPQDQIINFLKAGFFLQPKQCEMAAAARKCDFADGPTTVGVGGARAGGKSAWLFAQICLDDCQRYPGLKFLYLRKSATAAREQIRDLLLKTCPKQTVPHNYREQAGMIEFPNGSFVIIKHFKDDKDIENFLGQEYDGIAIEELTTLTFDKWKNLMTCLRTSKPNWRPRFYGAWNWGGIGHAWVMKVFYTPWEEKRQKETFYIKATVADNIHVNEENKKILESMTGWKYKSWFLGDPHFQAGQFFSNWNEDFHCYPSANCQPFNENNAVKWTASVDYGFAHPSCFHLHAEDVLGNSYTVDEEHHKETMIEEHAQNFLAMLKRHNLQMSDLDFIVAGKDCFSRKQDGRTIAMDYADYGIDLIPAEIDRVNAWAVMQQRLGDIERGVKPSWFISRKCVNLIAQIPMAQHHETRAGDIAKMNADEEGDGGDDALECARNYIATDGGGKTISFAVPMAMGRPLTMIGG